MVESSLFKFFSRLAQAYVWTKTKAFYQSCTLRFLMIAWNFLVVKPGQLLKIILNNLKIFPQLFCLTFFFLEFLKRKK